MEQIKHHVVWFDIPVSDLDRAANFYNLVLDVEIEKQHLSETSSMGVLKHEKNQISGCLAKNENEFPSRGGPLLYFNVDGRLDDAISKAKANGGKMVQSKHQIGEYGFRCVILDSEGNRIALHSS